MLGSELFIMKLRKKLKTKIIDFQLRKRTHDFIEGKSNAISMILQNRKQLGTFQDSLFRHQMMYNDPDKKTHHKKVMADFQQFYEPSNDIFSSSGQTGNNNRPTFEDLEMMADSRIGFGRYATTIFAGKCVRNGWDFYDWEGNLKKHPEIMKSLFRAKFFTEHIQWVKQELVYGASYLMKYWSAHDKFDQPPPNKPPIAYHAFPPSILSPINVWESQQAYLTEDDELWNFRGGKGKSVQIHKDRVEILNTRPNPYDYIGYSIFEPIYLSACAYMNLIVNGIKMAAKYGNVITAFKMPVPNPSLKMYREFKDIIDEMKATFTFILGKDEELEFLDTKIGSGLMEFGEFLKEDMAAGTGLPLNSVYGRADGGGLSGAGALVSKQGELETMSNYQADLADNYWLMFDRYWDLEDEFVKFRLDYQKTDSARYEEENMQWQNELLKTQVQTLKLQNLLTAMQAQGMLPNMAPEGEGGEGGQDNGGNGGVPNQSGGSIPNQTGGSSGTGMTQINNYNTNKAQQDFINSNFDIIRNYKVPVIDIEFRKKKKRY